MAEKKTANEYITRFRPELMGIAVLWVLWFHSALSPKVFPVPFINESLGFLKGTGYGGVDIFVFLSGFGICRSLQSHSTGKYFKNRLSRILPIWWTFMLLFIAVGGALWQVYLTLPELFGFATFTGFWLGLSHQGNWFVYMIVFFYLLSPIIYEILKESKKKFLMCLLLMGVAVCISLSCIGDARLIAFSRLPLYIFGMFLAMDKTEKKIRGSHLLLCLLALATGTAAVWFFNACYSSLMWKYGLWWYPFILSAPALTILLCALFNKIQMYIGTLLWCFRKLGEASLEIILVSDCFFQYIYPRNELWFIPKVLRSWGAMIFSVLIGLLFHFVLEKGKKAFGSLKSKKK